MRRSPDSPTEMSSEGGEGESHVNKQSIEIRQLQLTNNELVNTELFHWVSRASLCVGLFRHNQCQSQQLCERNTKNLMSTNHGVEPVLWCLED